jgi:hypothetical protein
MSTLATGFVHGYRVDLVKDNDSGGVALYLMGDEVGDEPILLTPVTLDHIPTDDEILQLLIEGGHVDPDPTPLDIAYQAAERAYREAADGFELLLLAKLSAFVAETYPEADELHVLGEYDGEELKLRAQSVTAGGQMIAGYDSRGEVKGDEETWDDFTDEVDGSYLDVLANLTPGDRWEGEHTIAVPGPGIPGPRCPDIAVYGGYNDGTWVWPVSMPAWLREHAIAHDVWLYESGTLHGSPVYLCNGDCCCFFTIDDTTFLDRFSLVNPEGEWCPDRNCPCHKMPTGEVGRYPDQPKED